MKAWICLIAACLIFTVLSCKAAAQGTAREDAARMVLVELFTSQGCDMCPEAERLLGVLAARNSRVVPIAFHVDYFNDPVEGSVLRQAAQRAPGGLQRALHEAEERRVRALLHSDAHGRRAPVGQRSRSGGDPGRRPPGAGPKAAGRAQGGSGAQRRSACRRPSDHPHTAVASDQRARTAGLCGSAGRPRRHRGRFRGECQQDLDGAIPGAFDPVRIHFGWTEAKESRVPFSIAARARMGCRQPRNCGLRPGPQVG